MAHSGGTPSVMDNSSYYGQDELGKWFIVVWVSSFTLQSAFSPYGRCLRRFRRGPGAEAGFATARAGPLPADRQHYQNHEERHSGEREDRKRCARVRSGVRVGVYFVHHVRGQRAVPFGEAQDHQRGGHSVCHVHAGFWQLRRSAEGVFNEVPRGGWLRCETDSFVKVWLILPPISEHKSGTIKPGTNAGAPGAVRSYQSGL